MGLLPYYMNGKAQTGKEFFENKTSTTNVLTSSAFASLATLSGRNIGGIDQRTNIDSTDTNGPFFPRQISNIPSFTPRLTNPLHPFTPGMHLYMRRDASSPSDSSNNGVSTGWF